MSDAALRSRLRPAGPWKVVLPGIYLSHNGLLAAGQREMAAVLYAGRDSIITGAAAVARQGLSWLSSEVGGSLPYENRAHRAKYEVPDRGPQAVGADHEVIVAALAAFYAVPAWRRPAAAAITDGALSWLNVGSAG